MISEQAGRVEGIRLRLPAAPVVAVEPLPAAPLHLVKLPKQMEPAKNSLIKSQRIRQDTNREPNFCVIKHSESINKVVNMQASSMLQKQECSCHIDRSGQMLEPHATDLGEIKHTEMKIHAPISKLLSTRA